MLLKGVLVRMLGRYYQQRSWGLIAENTLGDEILLDVGLLRRAHSDVGAWPS